MWFFKKNKKINKGKYKELDFQESAISNEEYKNKIGGKHPHKWDERGKFQFYLLKKMGMKPESKVLDIGCGPIRAGRYLIDYLNKENYTGFDYNESFISIAKEIIRKKALEEKKPTLLFIDDFEMDNIKGSFDFAIAFSVFNHCDKFQKDNFFRRFQNLLTPNGKLFITHAKWLTRNYKLKPKFRITKIYENAAYIESDLLMENWGWPENQCNVFPIIEIQVLG